MLPSTLDVLVEPPPGLLVEGHVLLGRGPTASGPTGWASDAGLSYRCARCGSMMPADQASSYACSCGAMYLDIDGGRFGSRLVDENVLVYRRLET
jgi:hypothetical protein